MCVCVCVSQINDGDTPQGVLMSTTNTVNASQPVTGNVSVALGGFCDAAVINLDTDSQASIAAKIRALPYANGGCVGVTPHVCLMCVPHVRDAS